MVSWPVANFGGPWTTRGPLAEGLRQTNDIYKIILGSRLGTDVPSSNINMDNIQIQYKMEEIRLRM